MKKATFISPLLLAIISLVIMIACGPSMKIKTVGAWVNREKVPPEPIKSVFIIAFTDNPQVRVQLEDDVAAAAAEKGIKAYKSLDIIGPVELKHIAPVKDVFIKKLQDLNCETIFTIALIDAHSETHYTPGTGQSNVYSPYQYSPYLQYSGYSAAAPAGPYGGFGGYYGFCINTMSTEGYYTTTSKYFLETKLFTVNSDETLLSIQSKVSNPKTLERASKEYTQSLMQTIRDLKIRKG
jgi:hypothetical protein